MCRTYSQLFAFVTTVALMVLSAAKPLNRQQFPFLKSSRQGLQIRSIGGTTSTTQSVRLQCKNLYFLQIGDDGVVNGSTRFNSPNVKLQLQAAGPHGLVRIYSTRTKRYIAMNSKGIVKSSLTPTEDTVFKYVQETTGYHTFTSAKHVHGSQKAPMFLALRNAGQAKKGSKTTRYHKSSQFLEIH